MDQFLFQINNIKFDEFVEKKDLDVRILIFNNNFTPSSTYFILFCIHFLVTLCPYIWQQLLEYTVPRIVHIF